MSRVRRRSLSMLMFSVFLAAGAGWGFPVRQEREGYRIPVFSRGLVKNCYYGGDAYSWNACRGGQRCDVLPSGEYYWKDDPKCESLQTSGGFPVY